MTKCHEMSPKCLGPNFTLDPTLLLVADLAAKLVHIVAHGKARDGNFNNFQINRIIQDFKLNDSLQDFMPVADLSSESIFVVCVCTYAHR